MAPSQFGIFAKSGVHNGDLVEEDNEFQNDEGRNVEKHTGTDSCGGPGGNQTVKYYPSTNPKNSRSRQFYQKSQSGLPTENSAYFDNTNHTTTTPDLQFHIQPLSLDDLSNPTSMHRFPGLTASVCNLRPTSRGSVCLSSPNSADPPTIDPNYLDTRHDRKVAAAALRLARRIVLGEDSSGDTGGRSSSDFVEKYEPTEHFPGLHINSDKDLAREAGNISTSIFHPVGTCMMGNNSQLRCVGQGETSGVASAWSTNAVVDEELRVHGVGGLRVVDASIMPTITSGNTNSPVIAIAEKASKIILRAHEK